MSDSEAQYLLRFDDLCPTMDRGRWERFAGLVERFEIEPILAVVPENCDSQLVRNAAFEGFWDEMRAMQSAGGTIGLHGWRHLCEARGRSLIPLHAVTEFAGVEREMQREWIRAGIARLRAEQLEPRVWVAPRHGFDQMTLEVLREEGIEVLSDGFAQRPFRRSGMKWIPQQLWSPLEKRSGLWTICVHTNSAGNEEFAALEDFLVQFASRFTSLEQVLEEWTIEERSWRDRVFHTRVMGRIRIGQVRRRLMKAMA